MTRTFYYTAFGLEIESSLELPMLEREYLNTPPDLVIHCAELSEEHKQLCTSTSFTKLPHGEVLFSIPEVARYLIQLPNRITVEPCVNASAEAVQLFLLGSAIGIILHHQRGVVVHGCAVSIDNSAFVFSGPSGVGKSTLASAFTQVGKKILTDDVAMLRSGTDGRSVVWPGYPQMKLWKKSLELLNLESDNLSSVFLREEKYNLPVRECFQRTPEPLRGLFFLKEGAGSSLKFTRVVGNASYVLLHSNTYRVEYLSQIADLKTHFQACAQVVAQTPCYVVERPLTGCDPCSMAEAVIDFIRSEAQGLRDISLSPC